MFQWIGALCSRCRRKKKKLALTWPMDTSRNFYQYVKGHPSFSDYELANIIVILSGYTNDPANIMDMIRVTRENLPGS